MRSFIGGIIVYVSSITVKIHITIPIIKKKKTVSSYYMPNHYMIYYYSWTKRAVGFHRILKYRQFIISWALPLLRHKEKKKKYPSLK
mmetsp:Transcript_27126/g.40555  ORF Transcript_27126/g.40555 Transcript_27126/m.40555 type:complete len:87 (+) Transcript_27126:40-300(+)